MAMRKLLPIKSHVRSSNSHGFRNGIVSVCLKETRAYTAPLPHEYIGDSSAGHYEAKKEPNRCDSRRQRALAVTMVNQRDMGASSHHSNVCATHACTVKTSNGADYAYIETFSWRAVRCAQQYWTYAYSIRYVVLVVVRRSAMPGGHVWHGNRACTEQERPPQNRGYHCTM